MTTIAIKDGCIAVDSYIGFDGSRCGTAKKLFAVGGGAMAGAGEYGEILKIVEWAQSGAQDSKRPELKESIVVWLQSPTEVVEFDRSGKISYDAPFFAYGSGREFAIGAMAAGASAREAVEIASDWSEGTGGEIQTFKTGGGS
jgi:ATP-dependent HslUV protease subunit HslV